MNTQGLRRKLAAILSADVKGYSRLMGENEDATVQTLTAYRKLMAAIISQHRGRVVDSPGDNLLAEFASVVDAVRCAVEIQEELKASNVGLPEDRRMEFRIGINLGDVIVEGERIYGDGVNVAARMEALAEGGGICLSGSAYEQIEGKLTLDFEDLGERSVKNIKKPVRVYRVRMETIDVSKGGRELKVPERPSIAVLPFVNMSGDPEQEYFSDGISEDIITDLSRVSGLFVIARNSVFTYKGRPAKVNDVGRELGVRYILEGSVRKANDRIRITAQLVDAGTGGHLWAERYDRHLGDIFSLQDEVTQKIVAALAVKLTADEQERLVRKYTNNVEAYDYYLRGSDYLHRYTKEGLAQARRMYERATELDPGFAMAHAYLGFTYSLEWSLGWTEDPRSLEGAFELAQRAVALDDSLPDAHCLLASVYLWKNEHERAVAVAKRSVELNPNDADAIAGMAEILSFSGKPEEAVALMDQAMRLNPAYPVWYLWTLGHGYFLMNRYEEAIGTFRRILIRNPNFHPAHVYLAVMYIGLGREKEARSEWAEFMAKSPRTSMDVWRQRLPYKDEAVFNRIFNVLKKGGLL